MNGKRLIFLKIFLLSNFFAYSQDSTEISLLFIGDVMQHQSQINHAYNPKNKKYEYDVTFKEISSIIEQSDIAIANLEGTLAGPPYTGYPQFSAPDALAESLKKSGVDLLVTANNHSCDRRKKGLEQTINTLNNLDIPHTGTFINGQTRKLNYPYMILKKGFKLALLNYTYGTNGIPVSTPNVVNLIDREVIKRDLEKAREHSPDKIIVFLHWGPEYRRYPSKIQTELADFLVSNGADIIVGSHPHVLQKMENYYDEELGKDIVKIYSLGNFISNQRDRYRDGGAMGKITLRRDENGVHISHAGYYLTWVHTRYENGRKQWRILPVSKYEMDPNLDKESLQKLGLFAEDSRSLLGKENLNFFEYHFDPEKNSWNLN